MSPSSGVGASDESTPRSRHLLIAGTGRAGTSFLVQYLAALGLDTVVDRPDGGRWFEAAQAGFEFLPIGDAATWPYVIKSPWLADCIDAVLARTDIAIDAVIVPVRDLAEAAASRVITERRAVYERAPWQAQLDKTWDSAGQTPGGIVYSLHAIDQARILAVGFHHLVQRLVAADIPVVLLSFPRFIDDGNYLYARLRHLLPADVAEERALAAHRTLADSDKVRVGKELAEEEPEHSPSGGPAFPDDAALDRIAIRRELTRVSAERNRLRRELEALQAELEAVKRGKPD